jgi:hypothetical protein
MHPPCVKRVLTGAPRVSNKGHMRKPKHTPAAGSRRSVIFSDDDAGMIKRIMAHEQAKSIVKLTFADIVRMAIRESAKKRGITESAPKAGAS